LAAETEGFNKPHRRSAVSVGADFHSGWHGPSKVRFMPRVGGSASRPLLKPIEAVLAL
jgi:hypothetical protein